MTSQPAFDFMKPVAAIDGPTLLRKPVGKYSYGEIRIQQNEDGTWAYSTHDQFEGYGGHGGPAYGKYASFDIALTDAVTKLRKHWSHYETDTNSMCTANHKKMARELVEWLDGIAP